MMFPYHYLPAHTYTMFITTYLYQLKSQCMRVEAEEGVMLQEKWKVVIIWFLCKNHKTIPLVDDRASVYLTKNYDDTEFELMTWQALRATKNRLLKREIVVCGLNSAIESGSR